jgi:hypothetical protein
MHQLGIQIQPPGRSMSEVPLFLHMPNDRVIIYFFEMKNLCHSSECTDYRPEPIQKVTNCHDVYWMRVFTHRL